MNSSARLAQATAMYNKGQDNIKNKAEPEGQKFPNGSRVHIASDLGASMSHFESDCDATVVNTYAHAYGGDDVKSYCLDIDGHGEVSWYEEHQLTQID